MHGRTVSKALRILGLGSLIHLATGSVATDANACGCLAPPLPTPGEVDFAVNQQSEQIIFEVDEGFINAHVLIRYAGAPESFGWLVPVPDVPDLSLSYAGVFGLIDEQTAPVVSVTSQNVCPSQVYRCREHPRPDCSPTNAGSPSSNDQILLDSDPTFGAAPEEESGADLPGAVQVFARQQIGAYDTVVLGSGDAQAIVTWLTDNGFIVNETMTPYMQPYLDQNMLFVAARLVPGAGVDEIRPLRMRYAGTEPMIPLRLTAVAAEPHLTVTAHIYSNVEFRPLDKAVVEVDVTDVANDPAGRRNYPMLLSRTVDEAGGDAFVREYVGSPPRYQDRGEGCCDGNIEFRGVGVGDPPAASSDADAGVAASNLLDVADVCGIADDGLCQCPLTAFDQGDCASEEELTGSIALAEELASKYSVMTRLTTRLSPEEMTFDPMFESGTSDGTPGRLRLGGQMNVVGSACEPDVIDVVEREDQRQLAACASVYCGTGECAAVLDAVGCVCEPGSVARTFTDLDGRPSLTCVPETPTVDFAAGGVDVPDVCAALEPVADGQCVGVAGFPAVECDDGFAAVIEAGQPLPGCREVVQSSGVAGAFDNSDVLAEIAICAPRPPSCSAFGWLERIESIEIEGVQCESSTPHESWLTIPPMPTCDDLGAMVATASEDGASTPTVTTSAFSSSMSTSNERPAVVRQGGGGCAMGPGRGASRTLLVLAVGLVLAGPMRRRRRTQ